MAQFLKETLLNAQVQDVGDFHMQRDALEQLSPPEGDVRILEFHPVEEGKQVTLSVRLSPLPTRARWVARLTALMRVTRRPPSSSSRMPSTAQPAGVVTASLSRAGW